MRQAAVLWEVPLAAIESVAAPRDAAELLILIRPGCGMGTRFYDASLRLQFELASCLQRPEFLGCELEARACVLLGGQSAAMAERVWIYALSDDARFTPILGGPSRIKRRIALSAGALLAFSHDKHTDLRCPFKTKFEERERPKAPSSRF